MRLLDCPGEARPVTLRYQASCVLDKPRAWRRHLLVGKPSASAWTPLAFRPRAPASEARRAPSSSVRCSRWGWLRGARMPLSGSAVRAAVLSQSRGDRRLLRHDARRPRPWRLRRGGHAPHHAWIQRSSSHSDRGADDCSRPPSRDTAAHGCSQTLSGLSAQLQLRGPIERDRLF